MFIEITSCKDKSLWYRYKIGKKVEVEDKIFYKLDTPPVYHVKENKFLYIRENDCKMVITERKSYVVKSYAIRNKKTGYYYNEDRKLVDLKDATIYKDPSDVYIENREDYQLAEVKVETTVTLI